MKCLKGIDHLQYFILSCHGRNFQEQAFVWNDFYQRWSRGHKARGRGQGQRHKKNPRPRPRTALPRTDSLEAKDRNARGQGQGSTTQAQVFSKKKFFSGDFQKKRSSKKILLVQELRSGGFYVQAYADDLAVLVTGADMLWIRDMAQ